MKFLFFIAPGVGHLNPTLPIAQELVARGEEVVYCTTDKFQARVESTGATFRQLDDSFNMPDGEIAKLQEGSLALMEGILLIMLRYVTKTSLKVPKVLKQLQAEKFDALVYDPVFAWGHALGEALGMPTATFRCTFAMTQNSPLRRQMRLMAKKQLSPKIIIAMLKLQLIAWYMNLRYRTSILNPKNLFIASESLNIVALPRKFQPDADVFDDRYEFVGPSILPSIVDYEADLPFKKLEECQTLYIAMGTAFTKAQFFKTCLNTFTNTPWLVVMATWKDFGFNDSPSNVIVRHRVPQLEVLKRANVFVTHGGMGSVMGALWYGVPLVVVPQMPEQSIIAARVTELGLGIRLDPDVNAESL
ncbi:MAG: hypothetical protein F6K42_14365, partial [Leptolyngbya sp. SIO1D8]|nr:hypothetical protein [Leptolyngbya sp. SIO1D8]